MLTTVAIPASLQQILNWSLLALWGLAGALMRMLFWGRDGLQIAIGPTVWQPCLELELEASMTSCRPGEIHADACRLCMCLHLSLHKSPADK